MADGSRPVQERAPNVVPGLSMTAPAEIDRIEQVLVAALVDALRAVADQATAAPDRLGQVLDAAMATGEAARQQGATLAQAASQQVDSLRAEVAGAVGAAKAEAEQRLADAEHELAAAEAAALAAADRALGVPAEALDQLKQLAQHPDWLGALVVILTKIVELAGDPDLTLRIVPADATFSRAIGLRHLGPGQAGGERPAATLALAVDGPGAHGLVVLASGGAAHTFVAGPLTLTIGGDGSWRIPFGGPVAAPAGTISVTADLHVPVGLDETVAILHAGAGTLNVHAELGAAADAAPRWAVRLGLDPAPPVHDAGFHATVTLSSFLGDQLAGLIQLTDLEERYSPALDLGSGRAPAFALNAAGAA